jgi:hypothetical protein
MKILVAALLVATAAPALAQNGPSFDCAKASTEGFDDAIKPANLTKLLGDPDRWLFKANVLQILFNPYDVGPYSSGSYAVDIPYDRIRSLFRTDGPIGR